MTIASEVTHAGPYTANGTDVDYTFGFYAQAAADISVFLDGVVTTAFSVAFNSSHLGGTITFDTAPANGVEVLIILDFDAFQAEVFANGGFNSAQSSSLQRALDRVAQNVLLRTRGALSLAKTDIGGGYGTELPTPVASAYLRRNSANTAWEFSSTSGGTVSPSTADFVNVNSYEGDTPIEKLKNAWAAGHRFLRAHDLTFTFDSSDDIISTTNEDVFLDMPTCTFHKASSYRGVHIKGGWLNETTLASDASAGATTLVLATGQGANWAAGDIGKAMDDQTTDAYGVLAALRGEFFQVLSVSTDTLTIDHKLNFAYATASSARVAKVSTAKININIGRVTGESETYLTSNPNFIVAEAARGAILRARSLRADDGCKGAFLALFSCCDESRIHFDNVERTETTFAYPLGIYNSEDCWATCGEGGYTRHLITMIGDDMTGTESTYEDFSRAGWTRRCKGTGKSRGNTQGAFDWHYGTDSCEYVDCYTISDALGYINRGTNNVIRRPVARDVLSFVHTFRDTSFSATHADANNLRIVDADIIMPRCDKVVQHGAGGGNWAFEGGRIKIDGPSVGNFAPFESGGGDYAEGIGKLWNVDLIIGGTCNTRGIFVTETGSTRLEMIGGSIDISAATTSSFNVFNDNAGVTPVVKFKKVRLIGGANLVNISECGLVSGTEFGEISADSLPTLVNGQTLEATRPYITGPITNIAGGVTYHAGIQAAQYFDFLGLTTNTLRLQGYQATVTVANAATTGQEASIGMPNNFLPLAVGVHVTVAATNAVNLTDIGDQDDTDSYVDTISVAVNSTGYKGLFSCNGLRAFPGGTSNTGALGTADEVMVTLSGDPGATGATLRLTFLGIVGG